jgi:hypothetical protein
MITRELIKDGVDKVQDKYLEVLYRIIQVLMSPPDLVTVAPQGRVEALSWREFIENTYGCLADDPIERGEQGQYEVREVIE